MTANTATARMATKTVKHQYYIYTRLLELLQLLGSKEAFFCSPKIVTATAATVNKTGVFYENIYRIYSKNSKISHSKHSIYVSISTVSTVSADAVQKKTI